MASFTGGQSVFGTDIARRVTMDEPASPRHAELIRTSTELIRTARILVADAHEVIESVHESTDKHRTLMLALTASP